mgnify:CR=1 FL=1
MPSMPKDPLCRVRYIDLTRRRSWVEESPDLFEAGLGGTGVGIRLLEEECPQGADPLGPDNPIILAVGPLVGHFHDYLLRGGFPQSALVPSVDTAQKLLREDIVDKVLKRDMTALFGVDAGTFCLYRNGLVQAVYAHPPDAQDPTVLGAMDRAYETKTVLFTGDGGEVFEDLDRTTLKRVVSAPVQAHGRVYGVLCLRNRSQGFRFTGNEQELLNQFLYIMAVALENAFMLKEVERARKALSQLTAKMITIQEEERRRLAADIHDTLTQALIGVSYKIQLCKELTDRSPEMLPVELDNLVTKIGQAIDQSRNLISSLRPDLIDTMGLVPALERHVESFSRETGIRVRTCLLENLELSSEANICLFRVAQEALTQRMLQSDPIAVGDIEQAFVERLRFGIELCHAAPGSCPLPT